MHDVEHNGHEELTFLELVLQLHGEFRKSLEPVRITPLQAGVMLFLRRHRDARLTAAVAAMRVKQPTLVVVVQDLVHERWVTKRLSVQDCRAVSLRLSRQGQVITRKIEAQVRQVSTRVPANKDLTAAGLTRLYRVPDQRKEGR